MEKISFPSHLKTTFRMTIEIDKQIKNDFKSICDKRGLSMKLVLSDFMSKYPNYQVGEGGLGEPLEKKISNK